MLMGNKHVQVFFLYPVGNILTCKWKYRYRLVSRSSGWRLLMRAIASWIWPFRIISRIFIRSSKESRSTLGSMPDSIRNFSAASLKPSVDRHRTQLWIDIIYKSSGVYCTFNFSQRPSQNAWPVTSLSPGTLKIYITSTNFIVRFVHLTRLQG